MSILPHSRRAVRVILCTAVSAVMVAGCRSARSYGREADRVADDVIREKQKQIGGAGTIDIREGEDDLRRKLMIQQDLPRSSDASLSGRDVDQPKGYPEKPAPRPSTQPTAAPTTAPMKMTLEEALIIGAKNSRDYQSRKEQIYLDALVVDLRRNDFRTIFAGQAEATVVSDQGDQISGPGGEKSIRNGALGTASLSASRRFYNGAIFATTFSFDVVKALSDGRASSGGLGWDATMTLPLLRGGGTDVVMEPLRQAERNLAYDLLEFEQYKRDFAVTIASQYLSVLSQYDQIRNAEAAYRRAISSTLRARRQADAGRLPEIQVDQSVQQELRSRDRWVQAQANLGRRLDQFKVLLGLPPDANAVLDPAELERLTSRINELLEPEVKAIEEAGEKTTAIATVPEATPVQDVNTMPLPPSSLTADGSMNSEDRSAIEMALKHRPEILVSLGEVQDAQRKVIVAANALQMGLDLEGQMSVNDGRRRSIASARQPNGQLRPEQGVYTGSLLIDLPLERTAERNAYRARLVDVEAAVRALQETEDSVKSDVRGAQRDLLQAREQIRIQVRSVAVAQKRVDSTNLFLDAGRAQVRDVLEAQDALVQAQNALTSAMINYRVAELSLQRDVGVLQVSQEGLWREYEAILPSRREVTK